MEISRAIVFAGIIIAVGIIFGHWISRQVPPLKECLQVYEIVSSPQGTNEGIKRYISLPSACSGWIRPNQNKENPE